MTAPLPKPKTVLIGQPNLPLNVRTEIWEMARDARRLEAFIALSLATLLFHVAPRILEVAGSAFRTGLDAALLTPFWMEEQGAAGARHRQNLAAALAMAEIVGRLRVRRQAGLLSSLGSARDENRSAVFTESFPANVSTADLERYIRSLPVVERAQWEAFVSKHRNAAFTLSGANNTRVLEDLRDLIARSLKARMTPEQFDRAARELLRNYQVNPRALRLAWNQTVSNSIRQARADELKDPEVRAALPFALYDAILDARVRPNHAAMEGAIAPLDWWEGAHSELSPPLGFSCRCQLLFMNSIRARKLVEQGGVYFRIDLDGPRAGSGPDDGFTKLFAERRAA